jgi:hypothetical protein
MANARNDEARFDKSVTLSYILEIFISLAG